MSQLDAAGIPWRVAATSPSLAGLWASAVGALGITVRSRLALPDTLVWRRDLFGLPAREPFPVTLRTQPHATSVSVERLRAIIGEEVAAALPAPVRPRRRSAPTQRGQSIARVGWWFGSKLTGFHKQRLTCMGPRHRTGKSCRMWQFCDCQQHAERLDSRPAMGRLP
jgi:hypothetical protein